VISVKRYVDIEFFLQLMDLRYSLSEIRDPLFIALCCPLISVLRVPPKEPSTLYFKADYALLTIHP
jgi:hypothetical protein